MAISPGKLAVELGLLVGMELAAQHGAVYRFRPELDEPIPYIPIARHHTMGRPSTAHNPNKAAQKAQRKARKITRQKQ